MVGRDRESHLQTSARDGRREDAPCRRTGPCPPSPRARRRPRAGSGGHAAHPGAAPRGRPDPRRPGLLGPAFLGPRGIVLPPAEPAHRGGRQRRRRPRSSPSARTATSCSTPTPSPPVSASSTPPTYGDRVRRGRSTCPGDPTSVAVVGNRALVAVVTSEDPDGDGPLNELDDPSGELLVIDLATRRTVRDHRARRPARLGRAWRPSGDHAAIVIENERDEDENDGLIPRPRRACCRSSTSTARSATGRCATVDLTGLADVAPEDPEPEYVDINARDRAVVTPPGEQPPGRWSNLRNGRVVRRLLRRHASTSAASTRPRRRSAREGAGADHARRHAHRSAPRARLRAVGRRRHLRDRQRGRLRGRRRRGGRLPLASPCSASTAAWSTSRATGSSTTWSAPGTTPRAGRRTRASSPRAWRSRPCGGTTYLLRRPPSVATPSSSTTMRSGTPRFRQVLPTGNGPEGLRRQATACWPSRPRSTALDEGFPARPFLTFSRLGAGAAGLPDAAERRRPVRPADPVGGAVRSRRRPDAPAGAVGGQRLLPRPGLPLQDRTAGVPGGPARDRGADPGRRHRRRRPDAPATTTSRASPLDRRAASGWPARACQRRQLPAQPAGAHRPRPACVEQSVELPPRRSRPA